MLYFDWSLYWQSLTTAIHALEHKTQINYESSLFEVIRPVIFSSRRTKRVSLLEPQNRDPAKILICLDELAFLPEKAQRQNLKVVRGPNTIGKIYFLTKKKFFEKVATTDHDFSQMKLARGCFFPYKSKSHFSRKSGSGVNELLRVAKL